MANSTFLELTNKVLDDFNEVNITQADFDSVKGIHSTAKNSVNRALAMIFSKHYQYSFNAVEQTETLVAGTFEYAWPLDYKAVEWNSFQIQADDSLAVSTKSLQRIEREHYYKSSMYSNDRTGVTNTAYRSVPYFVFQTHGQGFGISPTPDQAYELKYRYFKSFTPLVNYDDQTTVPEEFDHVIVFGAAILMNLFLDNAEQAGFVQKNLYEPALSSMRTLLINDDFVMGDGRVNNVNVG